MVKKSIRKGVAANASKKRAGTANAALDAIFDAYPKPVKAKLLALRRLIFDTAKTTSGVGALEEALKWGQPSYLTTESKSGSTIRIDQVKAEAGRYAVYFHCQTDLVETFRELYPELRYGGNRSILLDAARQAARGRAAPLRRAGADVSLAKAQGWAGCISCTPPAPQILSVAARCCARLASPIPCYARGNRVIR